MRVAEEFRQAGFDVQQSEFYIDQESGKPREIDVVAEKRYALEGLPAGVRFVFVVECKRATAKPWVFLSTPASLGACRV
jgi:predicted RecB family endonuclease